MGNCKSASVDADGRAPLNDDDIGRLSKNPGTVSDDKGLNDNSLSSVSRQHEEEDEIENPEQAPSSSEPKNKKSSDDDEDNEADEADDDAEAPDEGNDDKEEDADGDEEGEAEAVAGESDGGGGKKSKKKDKKKDKKEDKKKSKKDKKKKDEDEEEAEAAGGGGGGGGDGDGDDDDGKSVNSSSSSSSEDSTEYPTWAIVTYKTNGNFTSKSLGKIKEMEGKSIQKGINKFLADPDKYIAMTYQTKSKHWSLEKQKYKLYFRKGCSELIPKTKDDGWMTVLMQEYRHLKPFKNNSFPRELRDEYTDSMMYRRKLLHAVGVKPIMPGRSMGVGDTPNLKIIGDVDPSDICQGQVPNCWLLSAISALAEFDGAIIRLFRKTNDLDMRPFNEPNIYTITLYDVETWEEVDIVIDERLAACAIPGGEKGQQLIGAKPSEDGELWVCYLEKAMAIHCGGWDNITFGQCTHAWAILTGCKEQYTIRKDPDSGLYECYARYDPDRDRWEDLKNNPKADDGGAVFRVEWPEVGGGGAADQDLTGDELFMKMYAFDQENYIVGAGASRKKKKADKGLVDDHAYTVIEAVHDAAGTGKDLFKVRNPWGSGEIEDGEFDDDGPGWDEYPEIKELLNPVVADDGIFWVTKEEFFEFFDTIYVSASNMTEFLED